MNYLNEGAIPNPSKIYDDEALELAKIILPDGEGSVELLQEIILSFGVHSSLAGLGQVLLGYLDLYEQMAGELAIQDNWLLEIRDGLFDAREKPENDFLFQEKKLKNFLIRFHLEAQQFPAYRQCAGYLHIGIVGRHFQIRRYGDRGDERILSFITRPKNVLRNLPENFEFDDNFSFIFDMRDIMKHARKRQIGKDGSQYYDENTISNYIDGFLNAYFDQVRSKSFGSREGGTRFVAGFDPRDYFAPDNLSEESLLRQQFLIEIWDTEKLEKEALRTGKPIERSNEKAAKRKSKSPLNTASKAYWETGLTIDHPERLSLDVLARVEAIMEREDFIQEDVTRLAFRIAVGLLLHTRRRFDFSISLQVGQISDLTVTPILMIDEGYIGYRPRYYFGRASTILNRHGGADYFLKSQQMVMEFRERIPGYLNSDVYSGIPLPPVLKELVKRYWQSVQSCFVENGPAKSFLVFQDSKGQLRPMTVGILDDLLARLSVFLRKEKSYHPNLIEEHFMKSFDTYYAHYGLNCVDQYHISERGWHAHEMPVRYTLRTLEQLKHAYSKASSAFHNDICKAASAIGVALQPKDLKPSDALPDLRMGSWHVMEEKYLRLILTFLDSDAAYQLDIDDLSREKLAHNRRARQTMMYVGMLNGLRDFEYPTIKQVGISFSSQTFSVRGRGGKFRELPAHPLLLKRFKKLVNPPTGNPARLFSLYTKTGRLKAMQTADVNVFFKRMCEYLEIPKLDIYAYRHGFRTDLCSFGVPDPVINYLMGHGKEYVLDFSNPSLDEEVIRWYKQAATRIIDKYGLVL